ncbi:MAG: hypothetical protein QOI06_1916 [Nocardioidaceae bacterium]|jgi:pimeloyl-ACP methyl ester carboxylesterase|nr:hypothetical protein [Nocardioidaceae bacterium]
MTIGVVTLVVTTGADRAQGWVSRPDSGIQTMIGRVHLRHCHVAADALCGSILRPWDPSGREHGQVRVGFAFVPARDHTAPVLGTVVPHEGGPGYSSTGSASEYVPMYGPLLEHRNLLLVDQRGTGRSEPIDCPALQNLTGRYAPAAGKCGRSLGTRSDNYTTAESADDLAAVVRALDLGPVDLYGDSYGTFFAQVFAGRHAGLLRSIVLDSAYPTYGETAWYPTQTPAMRRSFTLACARSVPCASAGRTPMQLLRLVLDHVRRHPYRGPSHDADGRPMHVVVDAKALVSVAFGATYGPYFYREFAAALRSALLGDTAPLLRLVAEATGGSTYLGNPAAYSEGLDAAVACHDYPQLFDMSASPAVRRAQLAVSVRRENRRHPGVYAPFTVGEYLASDWQELNWCTRWPAAAADNPARPPRPPSGQYPTTPTLVLSGELDSITTPAEGAIVAGQFPNARQVVVANSFHVTAAGDTDGCAVTVLRSFVRRPHAHLRRGGLACAHHVPPLRAIGVFPQTLAQVAPARNLGGSHAGLPARRAAAAAAATVADLEDTWFNNYSSHGVGLRGGTWSYTGNRVTTFALHGVRLTRDLAVSGSAVWSRFANTMRVQLALAGPGVSGRLHGSWDTRARNATAVLTGRLAGSSVSFAMRAP